MQNNLAGPTKICSVDGEVIPMEARDDSGLDIAISGDNGDVARYDYAPSEIHQGCLRSVVTESGDVVDSGDMARNTMDVELSTPRQCHLVDRNAENNQARIIPF